MSSQTAKSSTLQDAWAYCGKLTVAIAQGRHNCHCGQFGAFFTAGRWHCRSHVERGPDGSFYPINPDAVRAAIIAGRHSTDEAQDEQA